MKVVSVGRPPGMHRPSGHEGFIAAGEDQYKIYGYRSTSFHKFLFYGMCVCTLGIGLLLLNWVKRIHIKILGARSPLEKASHVYVVDDHGTSEIRVVHTFHSTHDHPLSLPAGDGSMRMVNFVRKFSFRKVDYFWIDTEKRFMAAVDLDFDMTISGLNNRVTSSGLNLSEVAIRLQAYGRNVIEIAPKPIFYLLFRTVFSPFYMFQVFSVVVWLNDDYWFFASCIILMSSSSVISNVYQIRSQEKNLRSMVDTHVEMSVMRNGTITKIPSDQLVPGDILIIPPTPMTLHCDCVLMNGNVIVNESMLTGESVPILKAALPPIDPDAPLSRELDHFDIDKQSKHVLYCGTKVLQTRYYAGQPVKLMHDGPCLEAIVLRTAFSTKKGQLVRSIMYPKKADFSFTKDLMKFVLFLACIATVGFAYTIILMNYRGAPLKRMIIRALDIITIVVPPALPAAMTVGVIYAQQRLRKSEIFCISPSVVNTCGAINVVCFDKTGTLTEDGLDYHAVRASRNITLEDGTQNAVFDEETVDMDIGKLPSGGELVPAVAACQSLTRIEGELTGDPMDLVLFNRTNFELYEPSSTTITGAKYDESEMFDLVQPTVVRAPKDVPIADMALVRQFTFTSDLQRMSVLVSTPNDESGKGMTLYTKGSPEMILSLCKPETIPPNYLSIVNEYAHHGYRLIAVARRSVKMSFAKSQRIPRTEIECDLELLGLVIMENRMKPVTPGVINELKNANIRPIMVTGDNVLTALSVARECGIIREDRTAYLLEHSKNVKDARGRTLLTLKHSLSITADNTADHHIEVGDEGLSSIVTRGCHLSISGPTFAILLHERVELLDDLARCCDVYARMSPDQKALLVSQLQDIGCTVAFCGDGANDCAALKAAHAGISLSDAEASIAAPFTSKIADIRCVPTVIREGRAALVTSFGVFKFMAGYSLIQFATILHLYWISANLTDGQFLFIDLVLISFITLTFGNTSSADSLSTTPPPARLLSVSSMVSVIGQLMIMSSAQMFAMVATANEPWFVPYAPAAEHEVEIKDSMQGTAVFCVSMFQYISLAIVYSYGKPHRKSITSNIPLCLSLLLVYVISLYMALFPSGIVERIMGFVHLEELMYRFLLVIVAHNCFVLSYLFEKYIVPCFHDVCDQAKAYREASVSDIENGPLVTYRTRNGGSVSRSHSVANELQ